MKPSRTPLGGRLITRRQVYEGLGDPKTWAKEAKQLMAEFHKKPTKTTSSAKAIKSILRTAAEIPTTIGGFIKPHPVPQPAFAKSGAARRKKTTTPHRPSAKGRPRVKARSKKKRRS